MNASKQIVDQLLEADNWKNYRKMFRKTKYSVLTREVKDLSEPVLEFSMYPGNKFKGSSGGFGDLIRSSWVDGEASSLTELIYTKSLSLRIECSLSLDFIFEKCYKLLERYYIENIGDEKVVTRLADEGASFDILGYDSGPYTFSDLNNTAKGRALMRYKIIIEVNGSVWWRSVSDDYLNDILQHDCFWFRLQALNGTALNSVSADVTLSLSKAIHISLLGPLEV